MVSLIESRRTFGTHACVQSKIYSWRKLKNILYMLLISMTVNVAHAAFTRNLNVTKKIRFEMLVLVNPSGNIVTGRINDCLEFNLR